MSTFRIIKDPEAVLDYTIDWSDAISGDVITTSNWTANNGLVVDSSSIASPATSTTVWVSSGTLHTYAELQNKITTAGGRTLVRTVAVQLQKR